MPTKYPFTNYHLFFAKIRIGEEQSQNGGHFHNYRNKSFSDRPVSQLGTLPFAIIFVIVSNLVALLALVLHSEKRGNVFFQSRALYPSTSIKLFLSKNVPSWLNLQIARPIALFDFFLN